MRGASLVVVLLILAGTAGATNLEAGSPVASSHPLQTGLHLDIRYETHPDPPALAFKRARAAGAAIVRIPVGWGGVAPTSPSASFNAENPADPQYRWSTVDDAVREAVRNDLEPLVFFYDAPSWALRDRYPQFAPTHDPNPVEIARFAKAIARRYSGTFQGLPRVRLWQAWNEPNISLFYRPQLVKNRPISPSWYREVVTRFAQAVRSVRADNVVIAGGTAPFHDITPEVTRQRADWGPLTFMRGFLCLSRALKPTCKTRLPFDVWSHHPYTSGGPKHTAVFRDDVSLGDLPEMKRVLDAAVKAGHIAARGGTPRFWVTEFSWDSNKPDPRGVPTALLQRWVPEALYRMWRNGVSLVVWFSIRDQPPESGYYQAGLYYRGGNLAADRPKPHLQGFRFPVVAFRSGKGIMVWGRSPSGVRRELAIEQTTAKGWEQLGTVETNRYGIFETQFKTKRAGRVRARVLGTNDVSLPFSLKTVPDRFFNPFGLEDLLEPKRG